MSPSTDSELNPALTFLSLLSEQFWFIPVCTNQKSLPYGLLYSSPLNYLLDILIAAQETSNFAASDRRIWPLIFRQCPTVW